MKALAIIVILILVQGCTAIGVGVVAGGVACTFSETVCPSYLP